MVQWFLFCCFSLDLLDRILSLSKQLRIVGAWETGGHLTTLMSSQLKVYSRVIRKWSCRKLWLPFSFTPQVSQWLCDQCNDVFQSAGTATTMARRLCHRALKYTTSSATPLAMVIAVAVATNDYAIRTGVKDVQGWSATTHAQTHSTLLITHWQVERYLSI